MEVAGPAIALAEAPADGPVWNMLARAGTFDLAVGGTREFTPELFDALAESFGASMAAGRWPIGAPVGVNHARGRGALDAESTKAFGFLLDVQRRGDELWGLIDYTDEGRRRVRAREFQGGSIEFGTSKDGRVDFWGHTLTNQPAVFGLAPAAADRSQNTMDDVTKAQIDALTERLTAAEARATAAEAKLADAAEREHAAMAAQLVSEGCFADSDNGRRAAKVLVASMGLDGARAAMPPASARLADRRFPVAPLGSSGPRTVTPGEHVAAGGQIDHAAAVEARKQYLRSVAAGEV